MMQEGSSMLVCCLMWSNMDRSEEKRGRLFGSSKLGENSLADGVPSYSSVYTAGKMLM